MRILLFSNILLFLYSINNLFDRFRIFRFRFVIIATRRILLGKHLDILVYKSKINIKIKYKLVD